MLANDNFIQERMNIKEHIKRNIRLISQDADKQVGKRTKSLFHYPPFFNKKC